METAKILITNILETDTAFAIRLDTDEDVFVPSHVARRGEVVIGCEYDSQMIANEDHNRHKSKWRCIAVNGSELKPVTVADNNRQIEVMSRQLDRMSLGGFGVPALAMSLRNRIGDELGEGGYAHSKLKKRGKSPLFYGIKII